MIKQHLMIGRSIMEEGKNYNSTLVMKMKGLDMELHFH